MSDTEKASYVAEDNSAKSVNGSDASDLEKIIGAQIAQETDHEIKYRTCSWQKVRKSYITPLPYGTLIRVFIILDRRFAIFRIYLSSYIVLSMVCVVPLFTCSILFTCP